MLDELGRLDEFVARHSDLSGSDDVWEARASKIEAALGFLEEPEPVVTDIARSRWSWWGWKGAALAASAALLVFIGINQTDIFDTDQITSPPPASTPQVTPQAESGDIIIDMDGADYQPSPTTKGQDTAISARKKIESPQVGMPKPVADEEIPVVPPNQSHRHRPPLEPVLLPPKRPKCRQSLRRSTRTRWRQLPRTERPEWMIWPERPRPK